MSVAIGLVFTLGGTRIPLLPTKNILGAEDAVASAKERGLEMELGPGVEVPLAGTLEAFLEGFGLKPPTSNVKPLSEILKGINGLTATITEMYIRIPPTPKTGPNPKSKLRIGLYVTSSTLPKLDNLLELSGVSLTFEHEFEYSV